MERHGHGQKRDATSSRINLENQEEASRLAEMDEPVDIRAIEGRARAEDLRRLAAGEVTPEELDRENSFIWSSSDILYVDFSPKGTPESWARMIQRLQQDCERI